MRCLLLSLLLVAGPAYAQQPELVADLVPGPESSGPRILGEVNGHLLLTTRNVEGEHLLWTLSNSSLSLISDVPLENHPHYAPRAIGVVNDRLVFAQYLPGDLSNQVYWSSDGQHAQRLDTLAAASGSYPSYSTSAAIDGVLYFAAGTPEHGAELWATDGLTTWLAADIVPGPDSSEPRRLTSLNGRLMFQATTPETGHELWTLDPDGPRLVQDLHPGPEDGLSTWLPLFPWEAHVYFSAYDGSTGGLWRSDGLTVEYVSDRAGSEYADVGDRFVFTHPLSDETQVVYAFDGQTVEELFDDEALPSGDNPTMWDFVAWEDTLIFVHQAQYPEPNCDDVTVARWDAEHEVQVVFSGMSACPGDDPGSFTPAGDRLAFRAYTNEMGTEPAIYDGAAVEVYELTPGAGSSSPSFFTPFEDAIYFVARTPETGTELWVLPAPTTDAESAPSVAVAPPPFPNPARDRLHLPLDASAPRPQRLDVFDVAGRRVRVVEVPADAPRTLTLDLRGLPSGTYWLKVLDGDRDAAHPFTVVR